MDERIPESVCNLLVPIRSEMIALSINNSYPFPYARKLFIVFSSNMDQNIVTQITRITSFLEAVRLTDSDRPFLRATTNLTFEHTHDGSYYMKMLDIYFASQTQ